MVAFANSPFKISPALSPLKTGVYMIRNKVNGKVYVGSAAVSLHERWLSHRSYLRRGKHHNARLQAAWLKYGDLSFEFVVILKCSPEWCFPMEEMYILKTKSTNHVNGYNAALVPGGVMLGRKHSASTIDKMKKSAVGRKHTPDAILKIKATRHIRTKKGDESKSEKMKEYWRNPSKRESWIKAMRGKIQSKETREKRAKTMRGQWTQERRAKLSAEMKKRWLNSGDRRSRLSNLMKGNKHAKADIL